MRELTALPHSSSFSISPNTPPPKQRRVLASLRRRVGVWGKKFPRPGTARLSASAGCPGTGGTGGREKLETPKLRGFSSFPSCRLRCVSAHQYRRGGDDFP